MITENWKKIPSMFLVFAGYDDTECSTSNKSPDALFFSSGSKEKNFTISRAP